MGLRQPELSLRSPGLLGKEKVNKSEHIEKWFTGFEKFTEYNVYDPYIGSCIGLVKVLNVNTFLPGTMLLSKYLLCKPKEFDPLSLTNPLYVIKGQCNSLVRGDRTKL